MQKQAPTAARMLVMTAFALSCFGLLLFLWVAFGGATPLKPKPYRMDIAFPEAGRLAEQADVRMAGVKIGTVVKKRLDPSGRSRTIATVELPRRFAPLPRDSRAILRQKTLQGETYVELSPGTDAAGTVPEDGRLEATNVQPTVELDEFLSTYDPFSRRAYRSWQQGMAQAVGDRGQDLNDAIGTLPSFVQSGGDLFAVLDENRVALGALVQNAGTVFEALTEREDQLANLIRNSQRVFSAISSQREAFAEVWNVFPTFLDESRATYRRLAVFATDTRPLVRDLAPAANELGPALRALGDTAPDLRRLFINLGPLLDAQKEGLPALRQLLVGLRPVMGALSPWLMEINPLVDYVGLNISTLVDVFSNLGAATAATAPSGEPGAPGHYLRQFGPTGTETLAIHPNRLETNRGNAYPNPLSLVGPLPGRSGILASFDCRNAAGGGEKPATTSPACRVQQPFDTSHSSAITPGRFPRVGRADYSRPQR